MSYKLENLITGRSFAPSMLILIVLATNFTNEGEVTAHYLTEMLNNRGVRVSRIARGVPVGGELEFVDPGTLAQAFRERRSLAQ